MKLTKEDYLSLSCEIINNETKDGEIFYEKDGETLHFSYHITLWMYDSGYGYGQCDDFRISYEDIDCYNDDEEEVKHDFDEDKMEFTNEDFLNWEPTYSLTFKH